MTEVRLSEAGPQRFVGGGERFEPGETRDVSEELAALLLEKPYFDAVDSDDADPETDTESETNTESASEAEAESESDAEAEPEGIDTEDWLGQNYRARIEQVDAGDVDDHLDAIEAVETSSQVRDAVDQRRDDLEEPDEPEE